MGILNITARKLDLKNKQEIVNLPANFSITRKKTIIMITPGSQVGLQTQRMLLLINEIIIKEKQGLPLFKKINGLQEEKDEFSEIDEIGENND